MLHPGEVWLLPPDARQGGDPKARRHVLLTRCMGDGAEIVILAYASTRGTEAAHGAANVLLDPSSTRYGRSGRTGFERPTYIYPSRLVPVGASSLTELKGRIIDEMAEIRARLRQALGIRAESAGGGDVGLESWRGRVVEFSDGFARELECRFGLIVTDPVYSSARRYQVIIPILDPEEFEAGERDLVAMGQPWMKSIDPALESVWLAVDLVQSVFHPFEIARWTGATVDEQTLAELDRHLLALFSL